MAGFHSTQAFASAAASRPQLSVIHPIEHEKISCWFGAPSSLAPFTLLGTRIRYATTFPACPEAGFVSDEDSLAVSLLNTGLIVGVLLATPHISDTSSLLILEDGFAEPDFRDFDQITVLEVLP
ncbi:hypothetical protein [Metapseudomonas otitidis]|uniref:hypothetical protein n=1 Tax=Metapseudomonas otitidis TaxID=319939 RepID=UPI00366BDD7B